MAQDENGEGSKGVQSVEVGLELFRVLATADGPIGLSDLARLAGMHRAKAHRYLASLVRAGWVAQDPGSGHYGLGPTIRDLALSWLSRQDPLQWAMAEARDLALDLGETCFVAVWGSGGATAIRVSQPPRSVSISVGEGALFDPRSSATGRVFDAWRESATPALPEALRTRIRREGMACVEGDYVAGINGLSVPVFDARGEIVLALTLVGPASSLEARTDTTQALALRAAARRVSMGLGWQDAAQ
ncbi:IclR family transcriptional regulator [Castellaniella sp. GW247-6E4]|uniref:IclR family transcriptional regulator n=1 Tax=Castellaniella sp. GW247-6E4 TaxID=3140380 RepID=UPI0033146CEB